MFPLAVVLIFGFVAFASGTGTALLPEAKIVGGTATTIAKVPYQVSIQYNNGHFCGGSIYNSRTIITAAHCVKAYTNVSALTIRYGTTTWSSGGTVVKVNQTLFHPSYSASTMEYDIGLMKTSAPIVINNSTVKSIYMADTVPANKTVALISGWGTMSSGATTIPSTLQWANVTVISNNYCNSTSYGYPGWIKPTMVCAAAKGIDSCQGDSGGPLVYANTQFGIVSWGNGCANAFYPGVYASVPVLKAFITKNSFS